MKTHTNFQHKKPKSKLKPSPNFFSKINREKHSIQAAIATQRNRLLKYIRNFPVMKLTTSFHNERRRCINQPPPLKFNAIFAEPTHITASTPQAIFHRWINNGGKNFRVWSTTGHLLGCHSRCFLAAPVVRVFGVVQ